MIRPDATLTYRTSLGPSFRVVEPATSEEADALESQGLIDLVGVFLDPIQGSGDGLPDGDVVRPPLGWLRPARLARTEGIRLDSGLWLLAAVDTDGILACASIEATRRGCAASLRAFGVPLTEGDVDALCKRRLRKATRWGSHFVGSHAPAWPWQTRDRHVPYPDPWGPMVSATIALQTPTDLH
jgi:hypothetical protein